MAGRAARAAVGTLIVLTIISGVLAAGFFLVLRGDDDDGSTDPRAWFFDHRSDYEVAASWAGPDCCEGYYGVRLPGDLTYLSAGGRVSGGPDGLFFPRWLGVPDDAGGFIYAPHGAPEGYDMYGMACADPEDLQGGWWMCGLDE